MRSETSIKFPFIGVFLMYEMNNLIPKKYQEIDLEVSLVRSPDFSLQTIIYFKFVGFGFWKYRYTYLDFSVN